MSKKLKIIAIILIFLITLILGCFYINRTIKVSQNYNFNKVYNSNQQISDIQIEILDIQSKQTTKIIEEDVYKIINIINEEKITPNVKMGEVLLGGAYSFIIKNIKTNNKVEIHITPGQMTINNKTYSTKNNLSEKLNDIYYKY